MGLSSMTPERRKELIDLVHARRAVYVVLAAQEIVGDRPMAIGFDVHLLGTAERVRPVPGDETCERIWDDLQQIARAVEPDEDLGSVAFTGGSGRALFVRAGEASDDVMLVLRVRDRHHQLQPLDETERAYLRVLVDGLRSLGVQEQRWDENRARRFVEESGLRAHGTGPGGGADSPN